MSGARHKLQRERLHERSGDIFKELFLLSLGVMRIGFGVFMELKKASDNFCIKQKLPKNLVFVIICKRF